jgi:hypothetical protein
VKRGATVVLSGSVKPSLAGTVVTIERKVGSKWVKVAAVKLSSSSTFTYRWVPRVAGTYVLRATVPGVGVTLGTSSASKTIKVK